MWLSLRVRSTATTKVTCSLGCLPPAHVIDDLLNQSLLSTHIKHRRSHPLAHSQGFIHIFLPPNSLFSILQSCAFQAPNHLAKS